MLSNNYLCKYKNIFGEPKKGLHSLRIPIFDIAFIDVFFTILVGWYISKNTKYSFWIILIMLFLLGIILHRIFCVKTKIDTIIDLII